MKQEFRADPAPLELFYPPKWGINDRLCPAADAPGTQLSLDDARLQVVTSPRTPPPADDVEAATLFELRAAAVG